VLAKHHERWYYTHERTCNSFLVVFQINSLPFSSGFLAIDLPATLLSDNQSFSFNIPPITRTQSQGPCNVSLELDVNGVRQKYLLGTFQARPPIKGIDGLGPAFKTAFDQASLIVPIVLCGILGWGNASISNFFMRAVTFILSVLLIIPITGVKLTNAGYDIRNFAQLSDPTFSISFNQVAFVVVYTVLFVILLMQLKNLFLSLPSSRLQQVSKRLFFHHERETTQLSYVKMLLKDFRWAHHTPRAFAAPRNCASEFSYIKEAKRMFAGIHSNSDAFYFPLRLQAALLISTIAMIPLVLVLLQAAYNIRLQALQPIMPFFQQIFAFLGQAEKDSWIIKQQPLSQTSIIETRAFSLFSRISDLADQFIYAAQTSSYVGIAFGLLRFLTGQVTLLLTSRSNLLALRKGNFKIDPNLSDYSAFSFVGNQIACSLLGFVTVTLVVTVAFFALMFGNVREMILASVLSALPVIIFSVLTAIMT
jgi:hypothetical protein